MKQNIKHGHHGHLLVAYKTRQERLRTLADYFKEGLSKGELCVFVTPDSPTTVVEDFLSVGFDIRKALQEKALRIFEMTSTYLPHGSFVGGNMLVNVINFIIDAKAKDYSGLRTAGEMSWLYDHPEYLADATQYELQVNGLNATSPEFTGICLYPVREDSEEILESAWHTHPGFIEDDVAQTNPAFNSVGVRA